MTRTQLFQQIQKKQSFLCVGLDTDIHKIPAHLKNTEDPIFEFNKAIIDATHDLCVAFKPNTAFFEAHGLNGWKSLDKTIRYIKTNYPDLFTIADAKRGDIGNTSAMYARAFFEEMPFDSITVAPYMGSDSVKPFLGYKDKWVIMLALTSNEGAFDFQLNNNIKSGSNFLFEAVLQKSLNWGTADNLMYVVGATKAEMLSQVRSIVPDSFLLVPGVGAQGGSLQEVYKYGANKQCGLLVNASRSILYASNGTDFTAAARREALVLQQEMKALLVPANNAN